MSLTLIPLLAAVLCLQDDDYARRESAIRTALNEVSSLHIRYEKTYKVPNKEPAHALQKMAWKTLKAKGQSVPSTEELWYIYPTMRLDFDVPVVDSNQRVTGSQKTTQLLLDNRILRWNQRDRDYVVDRAANGLGPFAGGIIEALGIRVPGTLRGTLADVIALRTFAGVAKSLASSSNATTITIGPGIPLSFAQGLFGKHGYVRMIFGPSGQLPTHIEYVTVFGDSNIDPTNSALFAQNYISRIIDASEPQTYQLKTTSITLPRRTVFDEGSSQQNYDIKLLELNVVFSSDTLRPPTGEGVQINKDGKPANGARREQVHVNRIARQVSDAKQLLDSDIPRGGRSGDSWSIYAWCVTGILSLTLGVLYLRRRARYEP